MESYEPYPSLALALLAGLLIGLEREQTRPSPEEQRGFVGGIRTYPILALCGAVTTLLARSLGPWPLVMAGLVIGALLVVGYFRDTATGHLGLTSESAAVLTLLLGALAASNVIEPLRLKIFVVASIAVAATMLLSAKPELRDLSTRISRDDILATLKFLVVGVVVFPVLPDEPLGPYGALNPFRIGLMVVLIAGMSFAGYIAIRFLGQGRGLLATGAIGGLVSSTAVTLSSAARAKETPRLAQTASLAVIIASSIMFVRVLVLVFVVERSLIPLLTPIVVMAVVAVGLTAAFYFRDRSHEMSTEAVALKNPFELRSAVQLAAVFVVVLIVSRWASATFGASGAYLAGALAGLTDVDPITVSMANLVKAGQIEPAVAARTIVITAASNTVAKAIMSLVLGGRVFGLRVTLVLGIVIAVGLISTLVLV